MERVSKRRAIALLLIFATVLSLYSFRLFNLQIIETDGNTLCRLGVFRIDIDTIV